MKDPLKLQFKLNEVLSRYPNLRVFTKAPPWSEEEFREVAWVVDSYVRQSGEVVNDDPLSQWLEEYQFYTTQSR